MLDLIDASVHAAQVAMNRLLVADLWSRTAVESSAHLTCSAHAPLVARAPRCLLADVSQVFVLDTASSPLSGHPRRVRTRRNELSLRARADHARRHLFRRAASVSVLITTS